MDRRDIFVLTPSMDQRNVLHESWKVSLYRYARHRNESYKISVQLTQSIGAKYGWHSRDSWQIRAWKNINVRKRTWEVVITVSQYSNFAVGFPKALFDMMLLLRLGKSM